MFFFSLLLIGVIFLVTAIITYGQFSKDVIKSELDNQKAITKVIDQLLNRYFYTLKFITQNAVIQSAFDPQQIKNDEAILDHKIDEKHTQTISSKENISTILLDANHAIKISSPQVMLVMTYMARKVFQ